MSNHGRGEPLTGKADDKDKAEAVRLILADAKPYGNGRLGSGCDYSHEATEIAETLEDYAYAPAVSGVAFVVQVALWRWGGREWLDDGDRPLARRISNVYWPEPKAPPSSLEAEVAVPLKEQK